MWKAEQCKINEGNVLFTDIPACYRSMLTRQDQHRCCTILVRTNYVNMSTQEFEVVNPKNITL